MLKKIIVVVDRLTTRQATSVDKQKPQAGMTWLFNAADGTRISLGQLRISIGKAVLESRSSAGRVIKQRRSSLARASFNTPFYQFIALKNFLTYRSCRHLDGKHTVFGRVVGGLDTLSAMEQVEVDNKDCPIEDIVIEKAQVFVDPYVEADEQLAVERAEDLKRKAAEAAESVPKLRAVPNQPLRAFHSGVGKYINPQTLNSKEKLVTSSEPVAKKKKDVGYQFSNFSSW
ncbi:RING-type E3 ubiquitin-protein ligase ppil2 [Homalodisca vitripennis]|nr:RING-type E3 ubiquitin-protein ligase ppil2 [Homalodisca vitripennis]